MKRVLAKHTTGGSPFIFPVVRCVVEVVAKMEPSGAEKLGIHILVPMYFRRGGQDTVGG